MRNILFLTIFLIFSFIPCFAQDWQKIIPMVSTCKDVEKILKVKGCDYPMAEYKFPKYDVVVQISDGGNQWKATKGKVNNVVILFREEPSLETFLKTHNINLNEYTKTQVYDLPNSYDYKNERKGIRITVEYPGSEKEGFIQSIALTPRKKRKNQSKIKRLNATF